MSERKIRFGLWYDFRNPEPWHQPADRLYREILDQITWAEKNGFDDVWLSEHHFIDDGYLPSILPAAAAIAARFYSAPRAAAHSACAAPRQNRPRRSSCRRQRDRDRPGRAIGDILARAPARHGAAVDAELAGQRGVAGLALLNASAGARRRGGVGVQSQMHQPVLPRVGLRRRGLRPGDARPGGSTGTSRAPHRLGQCPQIGSAFGSRARLRPPERADGPVYPHHRDRPREDQDRPRQPPLQHAANGLAHGPDRINLSDDRFYEHVHIYKSQIDVFFLRMKLFPDIEITFDIKLPFYTAMS